MRKIGLLFCAFLLVAALSVICPAGDYADLKVIGFSENGKYLAFEESGEWDGAGGEYATTYYIDTQKNSCAVAPSVFEWQPESSKKAPLLSRYKINVAQKLKRLGIVKGNTGQLVVAHLLNDLSFVSPVKREHYFYQGDGSQTDLLVPDYEGGFLRRGGETEKVIFNPNLDAYNQNTEEFYELTLKPILNNAEPCSEDAYKIELTLKDNTRHRDVKTQILQKDARLPEARHCPFGYKIEQVYVYEGKIAVFLNVFSQGFEGPDMRYMAVTGELNYESNK